MRNSRLLIIGLLATAFAGCEQATVGGNTIDIPVGGDTNDSGTDPRDDNDDGPTRESNGTGGDDDSDGDSNESSDTSIWCLDGDGDGYGDGSEAVAASTVSNGYVADCADCDDGNASVHPGASDTTADGVDQDCNGTDATTSTTYTWYDDDDGDGYGDASDKTTTSTSTAPSGYVNNSADCDDTNANVNPGKSEVAGNGLNDDCSSTTSDTASSMWYKDADGDGYGTSSTSTSATAQPSGYVANSTDCNDANSAVSPAASEGSTADSVDNDCDGTVDEGTSSSASLAREVCVVSSTSDYRLAYYDEGTSSRTNWVTEVSSTATVVSPILTGSSGSTGCVSVTLAAAGTMVCFNGAGTASRLWGDYLVGANPGSGTFAYSNSTAASEVKLTIDSTVNGSSDSSAETATFDGYDLCWMD